MTPNLDGSNIVSAISLKIIALKPKGGRILLEKISLGAARKNAGYTQGAVAKLLNRSNATICSWERGVSCPTQPDIEALCKLYGVTYDDIDFAPKR